MTEHRASRYGEEFCYSKLQRLYGVQFATRLAIVEGSPALAPQFEGESDDAFTERLLRHHYSKKRQAADRIIDEDLARLAHLAYPRRY